MLENTTEYEQTGDVAYTDAAADTHTRSGCYSVNCSATGQIIFRSPPYLTNLIDVLYHYLSKAKKVLINPSN